MRCAVCLLPVAEAGEPDCARCRPLLSRSPCIELCSVDAVSGSCRGCGRTLGEISAWSSLDREQRRAVLRRLLGAAPRRD